MTIDPVLLTAALALLGFVLALLRHIQKDYKWQGKVSQALRDLGKPLNGD